MNVMGEKSLISGSLRIIKQIYHVWEGDLQKIPVLRLNSPRHSAREILRLSTGIFRKYPSQT
jgi:hypothetical protein